MRDGSTHAIITRAEPISICAFQHRYATALPTDYMTASAQASGLHTNGTGSSTSITHRGAMRKVDLENAKADSHETAHMIYNAHTHHGSQAISKSHHQPSGQAGKTLHSVGGSAVGDWEGISNSETNHRREVVLKTNGEFGALVSHGNTSSSNRNGNDDDKKQDITEVGEGVEDPLMADVHELRRLVSERGSAPAKVKGAGASLQPPSFPQGVVTKSGCAELPACEERHGDSPSKVHGGNEQAPRESVDVKLLPAGLAPHVVGAHSFAPSFPRVPSFPARCLKAL